MLIDVNNSNPTLTGSTTGSFTYNLTVTDANNCVGTDAVVVTVYENPVANAGDDGDYCVGATIGGSPAASGGGGNYTYSWSPGGGLSDATIGNPVLTTSATNMTYELTVSDGNQCSSVSSVTVTVTENPTVDAGDDGDYCVGDALGGNPTASGGSGGYSYSWSNFQLSDVNNSCLLYTSPSPRDLG